MCGSSQRNRVLAHMRSGVLRKPGLGAIAKRRSFIKSTRMCAAETRQPGSAIIGVFCVGCLVIAARAPRAASLTWMINRTHAIENPAFVLTCRFLPFATRAYLCVIATNMVTQSCRPD